MAHYFITTKHIAYNDLQQPLGYFYRLQEKLPLRLIAGKTYSDGSPEALRANYEMERFHYLAYWSEIDPLPGVSNESLHAHPLEVTFRVSGTQHKGAVLISIHLPPDVLKATYETSILTLLNSSNSLYSAAKCCTQRSGIISRHFSQSTYQNFVKLFYQKSPLL